MRHLLFLLPVALSATEYFVSGAGDDRNAGTSLEAPFRTIQRAANLSNPGDTINVMNGQYVNSCPNCNIVDITRSGAPDAWITYRAYPGHSPLLKLNGWNAFSIRNGASYIEITGFEIQGSRADVTFEFCRAERANSIPLCNGNGISVDGRNDGERKPHHIRIARNRVWQCAGGGINAIQADYITIEDNIVYENAWYARFANSGISVYQAWNSDDETGAKIIIRRNQTFNNRSLVEWFTTNRLSDGNGIIIDDLRNTQNNSRLGVYRGRVRVENNLSFNNGGAGLQSFLSENIDFVNNTAYKNGQVVGYADILVNQSANVRVVNNISYSRPNARPIDVIRGVNVELDSNLTFNGVSSATGPGDLTADPLFLAPSTEWAVANFRLAEGSPAIGVASAALTPEDDLDRRPRSARSTPRSSRGAYEFIAP